MNNLYVKGKRCSNRYTLLSSCSESVLCGKSNAVWYVTMNVNIMNLSWKRRNNSYDCSAK